MKKILLLLLLIIAFIPAGAQTTVTHRDMIRALEDLDRALDRRESFIAARQNYIDSLTAGLDTAARPIIRLRDIADAYTSFNTDSAIAYLNRGLEIAQGGERNQLLWRRASLYPLSGFFEGALSDFNSIDASQLTEEEKTEYLDAGRQMHSYIAAFYNAYPEVAGEHADSAHSLQRRMLEILPENSLEYKYNRAEYYFQEGRYELARVLLEDVLNSLPHDSNLRARVTHHLSAIARDAGDRTTYLYYLALSAKADVEAATREVVSLQELGTNLDGREQVDRAYRYLSTALESAVECGAALRAVDTSQALPIIERAHSESIASWRHTIYIIILVMAVLMIGLIVTLLILRYEMQKLRRLQENLRQANHAKEVYISQFLELCSIYMDKLNQFSKIVTRKLAAGQSDELYRMTKSGKFVEEQSREFYEVFDEAFLHIYPNFVAEVNSLLRNDSKIELKAGEKLNTDLRILAFMRLGIEESARIAQVLNYSLNTIYAYRNRLKARAVSRDTFEDDIVKIGSGE